MSEFKKALKVIGGKYIEIKLGGENNINPLELSNSKAFQEHIC